MNIDPRSPCKSGHDSHGNPVKLGDRDTGGYFVGYIDTDGLAWENLRERDCAIASGRFYDACIEWDRNGQKGMPPSKYAIARKHCLDPASIPAAVKAMNYTLGSVDPLTKLVAAVDAA
jgi:hypothetical protein